MENPEKEFGKLSLDQFKRLIDDLQELKSEGKSLERLVREAPKDKIFNFVGEDFVWAEVYELSFIEHLALMLILMKKIDFMKEVRQASDPTQYFIDNFEFNDDPDEWSESWNGLFNKGDLVGLVIALQRSILCILIYQKTLHTLIAEVDEGNDDALFDAVRIDRSILSCPTVAKRISLAEFQNDKHFFLRLNKSLKGLSRRHWESYQDLRFSLFVLRQLGFDQLSDSQLESLLVDQLKVYPKSYNARKNLRKQYSESKKINHLK